MTTTSFIAEREIRKGFTVFVFPSKHVATADLAENYLNLFMDILNVHDDVEEIELPVVETSSAPFILNTGKMFSIISELNFDPRDILFFQLYYGLIDGIQRNFKSIRKKFQFWYPRTYKWQSVISAMLETLSEYRYRIYFSDIYSKLASYAERDRRIPDIIQEIHYRGSVERKELADRINLARLHHEIYGANISFSSKEMRWQINNLPELERMAICRAYAVNDRKLCRPMTDSQISEEFCISIEEIQELKKSALVHLAEANDVH